MSGKKCFLLLVVSLCSFSILSAADLAEVEDDLFDHEELPGLAEFCAAHPHNGKDWAAAMKKMCEDKYSSSSEKSSSCYSNIADKYLGGSDTAKCKKGCEAKGISGKELDACYEGCAGGSSGNTATEEKIAQCKKQCDGKTGTDLDKCVSECSGTTYTGGSSGTCIEKCGSDGACMDKCAGAISVTDLNSCVYYCKQVKVDSAPCIESCNKQYPPPVDKNAEAREKCNQSCNDKYPNPKEGSQEYMQRKECYNSCTSQYPYP